MFLNFVSFFINIIQCFFESLYLLSLIKIDYDFVDIKHDFVIIIKHNFVDVSNIYRIFRFVDINHNFIDIKHDFVDIKFNFNFVNIKFDCFDISNNKILKFVILI